MGPFIQLSCKRKALLSPDEDGLWFDDDQARLAVRRDAGHGRSGTTMKWLRNLDLFEYAGQHGSTRILTG